MRKMWIKNGACLRRLAGILSVFFVLVLELPAPNTSPLAWAVAEKSPQRNYRVLGADNKRVAIVNAKGEVEWEVANEAREVHDIAMLPNGNVLFQTSYTTIVEMSPDKKTA